MNAATTKPTVIFMHLPRTGGMTLERIIYRHYRRQEIYAIPGKAGAIKAFKELSLERRAQIRLLTGHMEFGVDDWLSKPSIYITLLRNPIDFVISHYFYARATPQHPLCKRINSDSISLKEFVESRMEPMARNGQTRMVSGQWQALKHNDCTPESLEIAKQHLRDRFTTVGLTEQFDATLILLKCAVGWNKLYYAQQNASVGRVNRQDLPKDTLAAIVSANQFDLELYKFGTGLFNAQVQAQGESFVQAVATFRQRNRRYATLVRAYWEARKVGEKVYRRLTQQI